MRLLPSLLLVYFKIQHLISLSMLQQSAWQCREMGPVVVLCDWESLLMEILLNVLCTLENNFQHLGSRHKCISYFDFGLVFRNKLFIQIINGNRIFFLSSYLFSIIGKIGYQQNYLKRQCYSHDDIMTNCVIDHVFFGKFAGVLSLLILVPGVVLYNIT